MRSSRGSVVLTTVADADVVRGVAIIEFNLANDEPDQPGNAASRLIDASAVVTDVRLESL